MLEEAGRKRTVRQERRLTRLRGRRMERKVGRSWARLRMLLEFTMTWTPDWSTPGADASSLMP